MFFSLMKLILNDQHCKGNKISSSVDLVFDLNNLLLPILCCEQFFLLTSRKVLSTIQSYCSVGVKLAQTVVHLFRFHQDKGCFGVGMETCPQKGFVTAE